MGSVYILTFANGKQNVSSLAQWARRKAYAQG